MELWQVALVIAGGIAAIITIVQFSLRQVKKVANNPPTSRPIKVKRNFSWGQVHEGLEILVQLLGGYKPDYIVGVSSGGAIIGGLLSKLLNTPIVQLTRSNPRDEETKPKQSNIVGFTDINLAEKKLLLVDDVVRSGDALNNVITYVSGIVKGINFARTN
ncbi:phosphoribosyltransferase [Chloroflexota bacterium]